MAWSTKWEDRPVSKELKNSDLWQQTLGAEFKGHIKNIFGTGISTDKENLNAILTFECFSCNVEFDCNTTKFGILCEQAAIGGWKIKWLNDGYECYCGQCKNDYV